MARWVQKGHVMKHLLSNTILLSTFLIAGCAASQTLGTKESTQSNHFWENPNVDYVVGMSTDGNDNLSLRDVPVLEKALLDTSPVDRKDGLSVGALGIDGGNKDMILKLAEEIAEGQHEKIDSLLITHKGKLLFESYFARGRINLTHPQASATKTYTGLALGRAIQLGYLNMTDLDKPVISFLKNLDPTKFVKGTERVTLRKAMTMRSGIRITGEKGDELRKHRDQLKGQELVQAIFEQSDPITPETQPLSYGHYSTSLVMQVIEAVVPGTANEFIKDELFGKMGITTYSWPIGMGGLPSPGAGASITSRDMVKFGSLAMNKGKWNGEQLIPEVFISEATSRMITAGDAEVFGGGKDISNQGYGYFWWNADMKYGGKSYFSASAQGGGGQFIILIEELDLMVVTTGHERHPSTLQITAERILPAFIP